MSFGGLHARAYFRNFLVIKLVTPHFFLFWTIAFGIYFKRLNLIPSVVSKSQITTTKETIQPNNKAPGRTLLFGTFVSFLITVPVERPTNSQ